MSIPVCNAWVIATGGDYNKVLNPHLTYPTMGSGAIRNPLTHVDKEVHIPFEIDPFQYLTQCLNIEPILLVTKKAELDIRGLHRYGYVWVDLKKRTACFRYPITNGGAPYIYAVRSNLGIFRLQEMGRPVWPQAYSSPNVFYTPACSPEIGLGWGAETVRRSLEGVQNKIAQGVVSPEHMKTEGWRSFSASEACLAQVDWKTTQRAMEEWVTSQIELGLNHPKYRAGDPMSYLTPGIFTVLCRSLYSPFMWDSTQDMLAHVETLSWMTYIPEVIITEHETIPILKGTSGDVRKDIREALYDKQFDALHRIFQPAVAYIGQHVFTETADTGKWIGAYRLVLPFPPEDLLDDGQEDNP